MSTFRRTFVTALSALLLVLMTSGPPLSAQAALARTTLASAVLTASTTTITVASATGIAAGNELFVDSEAMLITAVNGVQLSVRRGYDGTAGWPHAAGEVVYVGSVTQFASADPDGPCTPATVSGGALPFINVRTARIFDCAATTTGFQWQALFNAAPQVSLYPRTVVAGTAYTILPTDYFVVLSTTIGSQVAAKSFTLPSHLGIAGKQIVIVDESGGVSGTTSIVLVGTINGTNSALATVIQMKTAFQSVGLQAGSGGWFMLWCNGGGAAGASGPLQGCR